MDEKCAMTRAFADRVGGKSSLKQICKTPAKVIELSTYMPFLKLQRRAHERKSRGPAMMKRRGLDDSSRLLPIQGERLATESFL